jgi:hypothetical protein
MIKNNIFLTFLAAAALTLAAACTASNGPSGASAGASGSAATAGQEQGEPSAAATFDQPLMATGGDLVMLRAPSRSIAG